MITSRVIIAVTLLICTFTITPKLHAGTACPNCEEFNALNTKIRDQKISRNEARCQIKRLLPLIGDFYLHCSTGQYPHNAWVFPVQGYNIVTAGNNKGRDYLASGYDYFDGNKHGGHPAFDLFIRDKNQDCLDDKTGKPVNVLSMTGGVVVALSKEWDKNSSLRGGKYIWVYDPASEGLVYYAHNRDILVNLGDILKPGDIIATVGRTGLNAFKKRSPTHMHLSYLKLKEGYPKPENIYLDLERIGTLINSSH